MKPGVLVRRAVDHLRAVLDTQAPPWRPGRADAVAAAALLLQLLFLLWPMLDPARLTTHLVGTDSYRTHDWLEVVKFDTYARQALLTHHRWPLLNPLLAGGLPQLGHPSDGSTGPLFLPSLLFGAVAGPKLVVALVALLGTWGLYALLAGHVGLRPASSWAGAATWAWAGWLPSRVAVGFFESCLLVALPALLALWLVPGDRRRSVALAAALLAALAIQLQLGVPIVVLVVALLAGFEALRRPDPAPATAAALWLALAGLLGAVKFLPMLELLTEGRFRQGTFYPTHPDAWYRSLEQVAYALTHAVPDVPLVDADGNPRVQEYMTLLPPWGALPLCVLGALGLRRRPRAAPLVATAAVCLWLAFGPWAPIDGFRALFALPLFGSMRGPLRYLNLPVLLGLCTLTAVGFELAARRPLRVFALAVALLVSGGPAVRAGRALLASSFVAPVEPLPPAPLRAEGLSSRSVGAAWDLNLRKYLNVLRGVPTIYEPEDLPTAPAALPFAWLQSDGTWTPEPGYRGEAWSDAGSVEITALRPNEVQLQVDLTAAGTVFVNLDARPGWRCDAPLAERDAGLLAVALPAGARSVTCRFRPRSLDAGIGVSLVGLGALSLLWRRPRAGRRGAAGRS